MNQQGFPGWSKYVVPEGRRRAPLRLAQADAGGGRDCNNVISGAATNRIIGIAGNTPVFGQGGVAKAGEKEWRRAVSAAAGIAGIETEERVMSVKQKVLAFLREEEGLTTVEYAIGGGLVGLAVVLAFTDLGEAVADVIRDIIGAISG